MNGCLQNGCVFCCKTTRVMNSVAAGTSNQNSNIIDMQGFEGVQFTASFGAITAGAVTGIKIQQGNAADGSDMADLFGTALSIPDTASNKVLLTEVYKPEKRYIRLVVTRSTQNAAIDGVVACQYGDRVYPVTHDTSVSGMEYSVSPAEGTP